MCQPLARGSWTLLAQLWCLCAVPSRQRQRILNYVRALVSALFSVVQQVLCDVLADLWNGERRFERFTTCWWAAEPRTCGAAFPLGSVGGCTGCVWLHYVACIWGTARNTSIFVCVIETWTVIDRPMFFLDFLKFIQVKRFVLAYAQIRGEMNWQIALVSVRCCMRTVENCCMWNTDWN